MRGGGREVGWGGVQPGIRHVPPVGATVAVDVTSPGAARRRALEDVLVHGQDCEPPAGAATATTRRRNGNGCSEQIEKLFPSQI